MGGAGVGMVWGAWKTLGGGVHRRELWAPAGVHVRVDVRSGGWCEDPKHGRGPRTEKLLSDLDAAWVIMGNVRHRTPVMPRLRE